jgi:hypothetical protein
MKKLAIVLMLCAAACAGSFYAGFRYGRFNGQIEVAAMNTGPLMNLLLFEAGKKKELLEMNREQLYFPLDVYDALRSSRLVSRANKEILEQRILIAKDYWQAAGGKILQTEEEGKKARQTIEEIRTAAGIPVTMTMNGVKVSPFMFEEKDGRIATLFSRYADQKSRLNDFIVGMVDEAKKGPNQTSEPTAPSGRGSP